MLNVRTNIGSINAQRHMGVSTMSLDKSMEKLASGFRINRAGDDAAGLAISEKLKAQVLGLNQASRNSLDGISMIQTAEGAMDEVQNMLQRMRELAVQGANDTLSTSERSNISQEIKALRDEIQNVATRTKFNNRNLLTGALSTKLDTTSAVFNGTQLKNGSITSIDVSKAAASSSGTTTHAITVSGTKVTVNSETVDIAGNDVVKGESITLNFSKTGISLTVSASAAVTRANLVVDIAANIVLKQIAGDGSDAAASLQSGANASETTAVSFNDIRINGGAGNTQMSDLEAAVNNFNTTLDQATATTLLTKLDTALGFVSTERAKLGAAQNRLEHAIANNRAASENLSASNSRIRDVDVAEESAAMARSQILVQAGVSVLATANQLPQLALKLLG